LHLNNLFEEYHIYLKKFIQKLLDDEHNNRTD